MQRRKFLIGLGSLAAGTAAATGTGAFTATTADRNANVNVVNDASGLVALRDSTPGPIVRQKSDGELTIDFTAGGRASGVNTNSQYQIGTMPAGTPASSDPLKTANDGPYNDPAFKIVNQSTQPKDVSLEFVADNLPNGGVVIGLDSGNNKGDGFSGDSEYGILAVNQGSGNSAQGKTASVSNVEAGDYVGVSILVNTTNTDDSTEAVPGESLSSALRIETTNSQ